MSLSTVVATRVESVADFGPIIFAKLVLHEPLLGRGRLYAFATCVAGRFGMRGSYANDQAANVHIPLLAPSTAARNQPTR